MFSALVIDKSDAGQDIAVRELDEAHLPEGTVTIDVAYSTLNYKDALAITGSSPVARRFPMVPESIWRERCAPRPTPTGRSATRRC